MRLIVAGGREVKGPRGRAAVSAAVHDLTGSPGEHTLLHSGGRGAARIAAAVARGLGWTVLPPYRVEWARPCDGNCRHRGGRPHAATGGWCPAAVGVAHQQMVDAGADVAAVFLVRGARNHSARDLARRARAAGITVREYHISTERAHR